MAINVTLAEWNAVAETAGTKNGTVVQDLDGFSYLSLIFQLTTMTGGTSPSVAVNLEESPDGVNWGALPAAFWSGAATPAALTAAGMQINLPALATVALGLVRLVYTVVSTPTITGSVELIAH